MKFSLTRRGTSLVLSLAAVALAGGAAYALIPQDGVISACYAKGTGTIRIIDAAVTSCRSTEAALSWNQAGVEGPRGPAGPAGPAGADGKDGQPGPAADFVAGKVTLTTACGGFCTSFRFRPDGYTPPVDSQNEEAVDLPIGPGAVMSDVTFTLSSAPPAGQTFQVGFTDGTMFLYCQISGGTSCSPAGTATFNGQVHGFVDTSYAENTGRRVTFTWKRTF